MTLDDLNDLTPALRAEALEIVKAFNIGPVYLPGTIEKGIIISPSPNGGANWQGAAVDPETSVLYVGSATEPRVLQIVQDARRCNGADYCGGSAAHPRSRSAWPVDRETSMGPDHRDRSQYR